MTQHTDTWAPSVADRILGETIALLEGGGPDAVAVREVARRAKVSLRDIYKLFGSRDELLVAAVAAWMQEHVYGTLDVVGVDLPLFDGLVEQFRSIFGPW